jgi:transposase
VPARKVVHVILDNYAAHKHPKVMRWLGRHPRFVFHFTPTSASWLNAVEGFFAKLTKRRLRRGYSTLWSPYRPRSTASSKRPTRTRVPSAGSRTPTRLSLPSGVATRQ